MTDKNCKLSLAITKPGNKTNRLTVEITQEQAQRLLELVREVYGISEQPGDRHTQHPMTNPEFQKKIPDGNPNTN